jgi:RNA polymerase sigma factor (sigma-70 family)
MGTGQLDGVVRHLRTVAARQDAGGETDNELLERFVRGRDAAAFELLVRRHGPMVLGVCRRTLGNEADAEDAFQATFLVLVRKAAAIRPAGKVGNWLYTVAYRTALEARAAAARRRAKEAMVAPRAETVEDAWAELRPVFDRELHGLPEKYRAALVLCDLEGKTRREAAGLLGCTEGTVASRLARGRALLARRLGRHGRALGGAAVALLLAREAAAGVPAPLLASTVKAAALAAAGLAAAAGLIPAPVTALVEGVTRAMLLARLKGAAALVAALLLFGAGLVVLAQPAPAVKEPPASAAAAGPARPAAPGRSGEKLPEPVWPGWYFDKRVRADLRMTDAQVKQLAEVVEEANREYAAERTGSWEAAKKRDFRRSQELGRKWLDGQAKALQKAAPRILSAVAIKRLYQIERQSRGLPRLLRDPAVQRALKLNDEQAKQIEDLFKEAEPQARRDLSKLLGGGGPLLVETVAAAEGKAYAGAMKRALAVLTAEQRRAWNDLVGEPFDFERPPPASKE